MRYFIYKESIFWKLGDDVRKVWIAALDETAIPNAEIILIGMKAELERNPQEIRLQL